MGGFLYKHGRLFSIIRVYYLKAEKDVVMVKDGQEKL